MEENTSASFLDFENPAIKNGVIAGIGAAAISLFLYIISARMIFSFASLLTTALFIVMMVRSVREHRSSVDFLSFSEALKPAFVTYVCGNLLYTIFYFVLLNYIDPGLLEMQKEIAMESIERFSGVMGEENFEIALEELENRDWGFGLGTAVWSFAWGLIFPGFLICLVIAAIMKDRKPVDA